MSALNSITSSERTLLQFGAASYERVIRPQGKQSGRGTNSAPERTKRKLDSSNFSFVLLRSINRVTVLAAVKYICRRPVRLKRRRLIGFGRGEFGSRWSRDAIRFPLYPRGRYLAGLLLKTGIGERKRGRRRGPGFVP